MKKSLAQQLRELANPAKKLTKSYTPEEIGIRGLKSLMRKAVKKDRVNFIYLHMPSDNIIDFLVEQPGITVDQTDINGSEMAFKVSW